MALKWEGCGNISKTSDYELWLKVIEYRCILIKEDYGATF
jgi:hypothetical protein